MPIPDVTTFLQFGAFGLVAYSFFYGVKALDRLISAAVDSMGRMATSITDVKDEISSLRAEIRRKLPTLPDSDPPPPRRIA